MWLPCTELPLGARWSRHYSGSEERKLQKVVKETIDQRRLNYRGAGKEGPTIGSVRSGVPEGVQSGVCSLCDAQVDVVSPLEKILNDRKTTKNEQRCDSVCCFDTTFNVLLKTVIKIMFHVLMCLRETAASLLVCLRHFLHRLDC